MPATALLSTIRDFPELSWASASTLNITGKRGNGMSIVLSGEVATRNLASDISGWNLSTNLDTGAIANSTWYYLYAVSDVNGAFQVKGSVTKPTLS